MKTEMKPNIEIFRTEKGIPYIDKKDLIHFVNVKVFDGFPEECAVFNTIKGLCCKAENKIKKNVWVSDMNGEPLAKTDIDKLLESESVLNGRIGHSFLYFKDGNIYNDSEAYVLQ